MSQGGQDISQQFINGGVIPAQLVGQSAVSKTYVDGQDAALNTGINSAMSAAAVAQNTINIHEASAAAHSASAITYSGAVPDATNVHQAIDLTRQRVDNIVAGGGSSNIEIVDARKPETGTAFPILGARLNNYDAQISNLTGGKANLSDLQSTNATVSNLINEKMDKSTTNISVNQINKNLGKIDQSYLSDELLAQIAGTAGVNVVPPDGSVTKPKMGFPVVEGTPSKNLFNKQTALPDSYIKADGAVGSSAGWYASDWIPVLPNTTYHKKAYNSAAFYDANKVFIGPLTPGGARTITTPANCAFVRLTIAPTDTVTIHTEQFELGSVETSYENYGVMALASQIKDFSGAVDGKLQTYVLKETNFPHKPVFTNVANKNLFNKLNAIKDSYIGANGQLLSGPEGAGWYASDWIPVLPNTTYTKNTYNSAAFYTVNKEFIAPLSTPGRGALVTPANCHFVRLTISAEDTVTVNEAQFELGPAQTAYESGLPLILREQVKGLGTGSVVEFENLIVVAKSGGDYTTITEAVNSVPTNGPKTTIWIMPGEYVESVRIFGKPISLVGLNKQTCIIRDDTGEYPNAPVNMGGGNHLANLTVLATHDAVDPSYTGEPSYAVHHDFPGEGASSISNCILISKQSAAVGIGTQPNQQLTIENCDMDTDTTGVSYTVNTRPALLFHPYVFTGTNQKLIVANCRVRCNYSRVLSIIDSNNNGYPGSTGDNRDTTISFYNNMFWSTTAGKTNVIYHPQGPLAPGRFEGYITLTADSYGNNLAELNP